MDIYEALDKLKQNKRIDRTARRKQLVEKKLAESSDKKPVKKLNESLKESFRIPEGALPKIIEKAPNYSNKDLLEVFSILLDERRNMSDDEFFEALATVREEIMKRMGG